ncbi:MAG: DnaD domain protein [Anaerolineae bacterium]|nr:DnaD domain protein [Anaerolineae bacterium]
MMRDEGYRFPGFPEGSAPTVALPELVFTDLVPHIDDPDLLKVVLVVLWRLAKMRAEGAPWVTDRELLGDAVLREALAGAESPAVAEAAGLAEARLTAALRAAVEHEILLAADWRRADDTAEVRYFANSPRGRASVAAVRRGVSPERAAVEARPNVFTLYEQNIGPLTALLSEDLMEAEETYPASWIEDAFREAVRLNKRNWKYILAILVRWQAEGRDEIDRRTDGRPGKAEHDRDAQARRYIEEVYDRIVRH